MLVQHSVRVVCVSDYFAMVRSTLNSSTLMKPIAACHTYMAALF